ncbi:MAG: Fis family transcriptional regulator [Cryomorphaceae bacterium BACL7 MAG-120910-bin2]|nr:MAG: Fis family transcriptional regulator [Cryomorphaceae bacterium BACL7 MAG-120910-bin2]KRO69716.1 MAG: Fis family transcriptional regulator [Cryomorphaceae bacterium BACL7 MAG-120322-bin74]KRO82634.1 MAG: Fis family transcriptional regulator [Cryomorphaceae bacterium BACL7 MAG-121220-bin83]NQW25288.1 sigma-54-dependent Fis family transcriptional regulator [Cryomorphaceae bacterium]|tara:strand:+ start:2148 stop:3296 length:1149 start_codon:yes stop_codon:yes gene_type:complete
MARILVVEDEKAIRNVLRNILLNENAAHVVDEAEDGAMAIEALGNATYDLVLCDIKMPHKDGLEVLDHAMQHYADTPFVMISGHGDLDTAVQCIRKGAYDYIAKPPDLNRLVTTIRQALDRKKLLQENSRLRKKVDKRFAMIGASSVLEVVRGVIRKVAPTDARVLIMGPNGSGKEIVANQIHQLSARSKQAFIEVNCAAIPSELIESELFGHIKGSFTSAIKDRKGQFELADGGTLFLDEIGDMSLSAQAKVLRALQESQITPVGASKSISVNVRVLAATNKNLKEEIEAGRFREDLYHRLSVIVIDVPSLNARTEDIPALIEHFMGQLADKGPNSFHPDAIAHLQSMDWTGNIRQLRNVVERLHILGGNPISANDAKAFA